MWEYLGGDPPGIAALIAVIGHIVYTIYRQYNNRRIAEIGEQSDLVVARGNQLRDLTASAVQMVQTGQEQVATLTQQQTAMRHELTELRAETTELRKVIVALERENARLAKRVGTLEAENAQLRKRLQGVEANGHSNR